MDISKHKTLLIVLIAILWIACIITGTTGHLFSACAWAWRSCSCI